MNVKRAAEFIDQRSTWRGWIQIFTTVSAMATLVGLLLYIFNAGAWAQRMTSDLIATGTRIQYVETKLKEKCVLLDKNIDANKDHIAGIEKQRALDMRSQGKIEAKLESIDASIKEIKDSLMQLIRNGKEK